MKQLNGLGETILVSSDNTKLDDTIKRILAEKSIASWILSFSVEEFQGMDPKEILPYFEDIHIAEIPVMPGATNSVEIIEKLPEESRILREGLATYDVRLSIRSPLGGSKPSEYRLIMNFEGQKVQRPGYDLTTRGIIYCARQISEQLGKNIRHGRYQDVEKVYSIWVVMDCTQESANTISEARWTYEDRAGHYDYMPRIDIERVILIRLPKDDEWEKAQNPPTELHRMLSTLFSNGIQPMEKLTILHEDFKIPVTETLQEEVETMCNYSNVIRNEGYTAGLDKGFSEGQNKEREENARRMIQAGKLSNDEIAEYTSLPVARVQELKDEM